MAGLVLALVGCVEGDGLVEPESAVATTALSVVPTVESELLAGATEELEQLRLTARRTDTDEVVGSAEVAVSGEEEGWVVDLEIEITQGGFDVVVAIELMGPGGRVVWSGLTPPIQVRPGQASSPVEAPLGRGPLENAGITALSIVGGEDEIEEGEESAFEVEVEGAEGEPEVFWESSEPEVASVDETGAATGHLPGTVTIQAMAGRHSDERTLTVTQRVEEVEVEPEEARLTELNAEVEFTAVPLDPRGDEVAGREVEWGGGGEVLELLGDGRYRAVAPGSAVVTAEVSGVVGSAEVEVVQEVAEVELEPTELHFTALEETATLEVVARDSGGSLITDDPGHFQWSSSDPSVASVSEGVVIAFSEGEAVVTAELEGVIAQATVTVEQVAQELVVEPREAGIPPGETVDLNAQALDARGHVITSRPGDFQWTSLHPEVATVDITGRVTGEAPGEAEIMVRFQGLATPVQITVQETVLPVSNILHYDLDDCSGDVIRNRGNADATIEATFEWLSPGAPGIGTECGLRIADAGGVNPNFPLILEGDFTIDFHFRFHQGTDLHYMWNDLDVTGGESFRAFTNGLAGSGIMVRLPWGDDILPAGLDLQDGNWYNIRLVMDSRAGTSTLYVDGEPVGQSSYDGQGFQANEGVFRVMGRRTGSSTTADYDRYVWAPGALHPGGAEPGSPGR